jgi:hypothetical protein
VSRLVTSLFAFTMLPGALVLVPVVSTAPAPAPVEVELREDAAEVPSDPGADGVAVGDEQSPGDFTTVGLTWDAATEGDPGLSVRTRSGTGRWSAWEPVNAGEGETEIVDGRRVSEPMFVGERDRVQVRSKGAPPKGLEVVTVDPGTSPADEDPGSAGLVGGAGSTATAAVARPEIISRAQWGADETLRTHNASCSGEASYASSLKAGTLHHTAGSNSYTASQSAGIVRAAYAYHVKVNGWCDIGYNLLVDKYGQTFEGRAGGVDRNVIGAHAGGFNTGTVGLSIIGNYQDAVPTAAALEAAAQVLAWRFQAEGVDPKGRTTLVSGGNEKYSAGTPVTVNNLFGHKDTGSTACPGVNLYPKLTTIRDRMAALIAANPLPPPRSATAFVPVALNSTGSGTLEVHPLDGKDFDTFTAHIATAFPAVPDADWRFFVAPYRGSGDPDLWGVGLRGTGSGKVEVHVLSADSGYRKFAAHIATAQPVLPAGRGVDLAVSSYAGDRQSNLFIIPWQSTGSGTVEVHVLSEASGFTRFLTHSASALPTAQVRPGEWRFFASDAQGSGDLVGLWHLGDTGSAKSEVHSLSRSSGYQSWASHLALPVGRTSDTQYDWVVGDQDRDGAPELLLVQMNGTASGRVQISVLDGASGWTSRSTTKVTPLGTSDPAKWQYGLR